MQRTNKAKSWFFRKTKVHKPLKKLIKREIKLEIEYYNKYQRNLEYQQCVEKRYSNKLENLQEMDNFKKHITYEN